MKNKQVIRKYQQENSLGAVQNARRKHRTAASLDSKQRIRPKFKLTHDITILLTRFHMQKLFDDF